MKTISTALDAHLAQQYQTLATCWLTVRRDGTVYAFTDHDADLVFNLESAMIALGLTPPPGIDGTGSRTYKAATGFTSSNLQSSLGMNVNTAEAQGVLVSPAITELDLRAGLWDYAAIAIFKVNWADLTMGALIERTGHIGQVTTSRGFFRAEWRGLTQRYQVTFGRVTSPYCDAVLGDSRCQKDLSGFVVTGEISSASADNRTIYDALRTEPGPSGGIGISAITNANPGRVTLVSAWLGSNGDAISISNAHGMTAVNTTTFIRNLAGDKLSFDLSIDTSDTAAYPPYTGSGVVTPLGATSGYFDGGLMTFTSGANSGISIEVEFYVQQQWTLATPAPYPISPGNQYRMTPGCDHSRDTCINRYNNIVHFRGFPYLPGIDRMVQIGRHG